MVSPLTSQLNHEALCSKFVLPKSSFMSGSKLFSSNMPCSTVPRRTRRSHCFASAKDLNFDHIPKQFRGDNLKEGVAQNVPQYFYGLNPAQMDMFMTEDSPVRRQSEKVTEESISSRRNYLDNGGTWSMSGMNVADSRRYSMSVQMYRGGGDGGGGGARPRTAPPDLPSLLLDARICYLGMPAKELDANTEYYIELLAKGTGKSIEQINEDIKRPKYLQAQAAIDYGIADKIADSQDSSFEKRDYDGTLAQSRAMGKPGGGSPTTPAGFR